MSAFTTVANVQQYLGLAAGTDDALFARLISACGNALETAVSRRLLSAARSATLDGHGKPVLLCPDYPVSAVTALTLDGVAIAPAPPGDTFSAGYRFDATRIWLQGGAVFSRGQGNVSLSYTAGYAPDSAEASVLEQLCIESVALKYKQKDFVGYASKALAGETVSFVQQDFPPAVKSLLQNFTRVIPTN